MLDIAPDACGEPDPASIHTLGLDEIAQQPTVFKCMGRSYSATRSGGSVTIQDITDITRLLSLGVAEATDDGLWDVRTPQGLTVKRTRGALEAVAALRKVTWPPRDRGHNPLKS